MLEHLNVALFQWVNAGAGKEPLLDGIAIFFAETGPFILILTFIVSWLRSSDDQKLVLVAATEAAVVGLLCNQLIGLFYFHPRPFVLGLCTPLFAHAPDNSFPSDHGTFLFAATLYVLASRLMPRRGLALLAVSVLTAWARVYCGVHFPFDMFASFGVGILAAWLIFILRHRLAVLNRNFIVIYVTGLKVVSGFVPGHKKPPCDKAE